MEHEESKIKRAPRRNIARKRNISFQCILLVVVICMFIIVPISNQSIMFQVDKSFQASDYSASYIYQYLTEGIGMDNSTEVMINKLRQDSDAQTEQIKLMNDKIDKIGNELNISNNVNRYLGGDEIIKSVSERMILVERDINDLKSKVEAVKQEQEIIPDTTPIINDAQEEKGEESSAVNSVEAGNEGNVSTAEADAPSDITIASNITSSPCSSVNSKEWLESERLSNIEEDNLTDEMVQSLIIYNSPASNDNGSKDVLGQTVCLPDSPFMNWQPPKFERKESKEEYFGIRHLAFRLMFLALHENQFGPARKEALSRYGFDSKCSMDSHTDLLSSLKASGVGKLDYECPDTKYLISYLPEIGFGAAVRSGMLEAFFAGMITGRVVLFVNSLEYAPYREHRLKSLLASCPRADMQCMYMPFSPCVITKDEFLNAPKFSKGEMNGFRKTGKLPESYENEKVLILDADISRLKMPPPGIGDAFVKTISSFYENQDNTQSSAPWNLDDETLNKVYDYIRDPSADVWIFHQVSTFYILRPNMQAKNNLKDAMNEIFPENFNPDSALGLPIRGSDKCGTNGHGGESKCLSFAESMQMAKEFKSKREEVLKAEGKDIKIENIILSSEDKRIIEARLNYTKGEDFPFDFIINDKDAGQGSGFPKLFGDEADYVMFSSLVSLQMQMHSESILVNGCSNFHRLMIDLVIHGCGSHNYLEEYKDNDNPAFRMKCKWKR